MVEKFCSNHGVFLVGEGQNVQGGYGCAAMATGRVTIPKRGGLICGFRIRRPFATLPSTSPRLHKFWSENLEYT